MMIAHTRCTSVSALGLARGQQGSGYVERGNEPGLNKLQRYVTFYTIPSPSMSNSSKNSCTFDRTLDGRHIAQKARWWWLDLADSNLYSRKLAE